MSVPAAWTWPLQHTAPLMPDVVGQFGHRRKFDTHTGVDLYCELGTNIVACEDGIVVNIQWFTGANALTEDGIPSNWWNDTKAILVVG
jgi:murein DD-endopeptidase MepM/ murein hydrolase activator NlpD